MKKLMVAFGLLGGFVFGEVSLSVAGLQISTEGYKGAGDSFEANLTPFNGGDSETTRLALLLKSSGKSIIKVNHDESTVAEFRDDQGSDLLAAKPQFRNSPFGSSFDQISEDGKACLLQLSSTARPKAGSKHLIAKGTVSLSIASKSETIKLATIQLEIGQEVEIDGQTLELTKVGKPQWGDAEIEVTLKGPINLKDYKTVIFRDKKGNTIQSKSSSWSSMGMFGKSTFEMTYGLEIKPEEFSLELEKWTDLEVIEVPFDLKVGLGL